MNTANSLPVLSVKKRPAIQGDLPFILATWLRSLFYGHRFYGSIKKDVFFRQYERLLKRVIPLCTVEVACLSDDENVILGYVVYRGSTLHWVYVKQSWRRMGIASRLLPEVITKITHKTRMIEKLIPEEWDFVPLGMEEI